MVILAACSSSDDGLSTDDVTKVCKSGADCSTGLCNADTGACLPASAGDGQQSGSETDVDCGGPSAAACGDGKKCGVASDCKSAVCTGSVCQVPTTSDSVKNGAETDVDCGGGTAPKCADTKACATRDDCTSQVCLNAVCTAPTDADGVQNGTETDVDCGGAAAKPCGADLKCASSDDCASKNCDGTTGKCLAPTYTDGIQNGDESDVDCGGLAGKECGAGLKCTKAADCASGGCSYAKICAPKQSCTAQHGGDTCLKDDGTTESCCTQVTVPEVAKYTGAAFTVDKYLATAGRMRAFLTAVNGNVRAYITANKPAWWRDEWTPWLPASFNGHIDNDYAKDVISTTVQGWNKGEFVGNAPNTVTSTSGAAHAITLKNVNASSAWAHVAGGVLYDQGSQGCYLGEGGTGHPTYAVPRADAAAIYGDNYARWIPQDALDERPINCSTNVVLAALCAFDGGQPIGDRQYAFLYDDDGAMNAGGTALSPGRSTYPWGNPPAMTCTANATTGITTCVPGAGYDRENKPHPGGYRDLRNKQTNVTAWTQVGPGNDSFSSNACPACNDGWVNWQFNYQDERFIPWNDAALTPAEQSRRARDQSYFISVPGTFPKGASRAFAGQRVQDIAGLMYENAIYFSNAYTPVATYFSFGTDQTDDDVVVSVAKIPAYGGSFEGHQVGAGTSYPVGGKYGKMSTRCVYPVK